MYDAGGEGRSNLSRDVIRVFPSVQFLVRQPRRTEQDVGDRLLGDFVLVVRHEGFDATLACRSPVLQTTHPIGEYAEETAVGEKIAVARARKAKTVLLLGPRANVLTVSSDESHVSRKRIRSSVEPAVITSPRVSLYG